MGKCIDCLNGELEYGACTKCSCPFYCNVGKKNRKAKEEVKPIKAGASLEELEAELQKLNDQIFYEEMADLNYNFSYVAMLEKKKKVVEEQIKALKGEQ